MIDSFGVVAIDELYSEIACTHMHIHTHAHMNKHNTHTHTHAHARHAHTHTHTHVSVVQVPHGPHNDGIQPFPLSSTNRRRDQLSP